MLCVFCNGLFFLSGLLAQHMETALTPHYLLSFDQTVIYTDKEFLNWILYFWYWLLLASNCLCLSLFYK